MRDHEETVFEVAHDRPPRSAAIGPSCCSASAFGAGESGSLAAELVGVLTVKRRTFSLLPLLLMPISRSPGAGRSF